MGGMSMNSGIGMAVVGAIVLIVLATILPTIFGAFGQTHLLTQAACEYNGERFAYVNSAKDWSGTDTAAEQTSGATTCTAGTGDAVVYLPSGASITPATGVIANSTWMEPLSIVEENSGINKLIITALPVLAIIGVFGLLLTWYRGGSRHMA